MSSPLAFVVEAGSAFAVKEQPVIVEDLPVSTGYASFSRFNPTRHGSMQISPALIAPLDWS